MLVGVLLIAAGVGLFVTAPTFLDVGDEVNRWRAADAKRRGVPRPLQRAFDLNARWGARSTVWFGRAVGAAAIVAGVVVLVTR